MELPGSFFITVKGARYCFRPVRPADKELLQQGFSQLSEQSRYLRFFQPINRLSQAQLRYLTHIDGEQHVAWGILDESDGKSIPVGLGRFIRIKEEQEIAEVAITIVDAYQRRGLGHLLFATLHLIAARMGVRIFRYYVHDANRFVLHALQQFETIRQKNEDQMTVVDMGVIPTHQVIADRPVMRTFKEAMKRVEGEML